MEVKNRILLKATEMFFTLGIRSVTMDDIAKELGISKKTIYLNYPDKDELVYQMMHLEMHRDKCDWEVLCGQNANQIEIQIEAMKLMKKSISGMNASVIFDIKRYHPRAWTLLESHKKDFVIPTLEQHIQQGILEGLFRPDVNVPLLARFRFGAVMLGFDTTLFPTNQYDIVEIQTTMMDHFIRGLLTEKGYLIYNTIKNK
jgi:TetR/AcrR family transcriptional regulator, cholesterol catabolism regulator